MKSKSPAILLGVCSLLLTGACGDDGPIGFGLPTSSRISASGGSGSLTSLHIFSAVDDASVQGEGFYADFGAGQPIFVASRFSDDPHDIANVQRKFQAVLRGVNRVTCAVTEPLRVFVESKVNLGAEHRLLTEEDYLALAVRVREIGIRDSIELVYYRDLEFEFDTIPFPCAYIENVGDITMTTGGSVYLVPVSFSDGTDDLNVLVATRHSDALDVLSGVQAAIQACAGSDQRIMATGPQYQEEIFTTDGLHSGWTAFVYQMEIQEADNGS